MRCDVAVQTTMPIGIARAVVSRQIDVASVGMTAQTEKAVLLDQQGAMVGAVRGVAIRTALTHRCVLPQERAALIGVTGVTGLVFRVLHEQARCGSMDVVATGAVHAALSHRMMRDLHHLGTNIAMALVAGLRDRPFRQQSALRVFLHDDVARRATYVVSVVGSGFPAETATAFVALQADGTLLLRIELLKSQIAIWVLNVLASRPMAALAFAGA